MTKLSNITECITNELNTFEERLNKCLHAEKYLLKDMIDYCFAKKGKRIRPILTFLVANMFGKPSESTFRAAMVLEFIHTASLIHDDVLDESGMRRGRQSINNIWGNNNAILFGDYLYGKCMEFIKTEKDFSLMPIYARIGVSLPKGELLQKNLTEQGSTTEKNYFEVIYNKTASLLEAACETGFLTANEKDTDNNNLKNFDMLNQIKEMGKNLGLAFQIKDDMLDFYLENASEKSIGNDIREKKITLPMIYFLQNTNEQHKNDVLNFINSDEKRDEGILHLIKCVRESNSLKQSQRQVEFFSGKACDIIRRCPDNVYKDALLSLAGFLINRGI
ncbi:MAG: polyprenyl synthetase family protein [Bacteroidales bacterium]|jgi:octaprenyl-diphosphate synthase|nr:polyprenyl synthetase family protein [Bacteroidales bacterium]